MQLSRTLISPFARLRAGALAMAFGVLAGAMTPALAEDNPLGLIDPAVISVGTMGDAKPYAFTTADGAAWLAVAHGPGAPTRFGFTIALPEGMALEPMPSGGLDFMHPHYGATVGRLYRPWASDAMFRPLPAEYHVREPAVLTVNVDAAGASYPFVVGVVYGASPR